MLIQKKRGKEEERSPFEKNQAYDETGPGT
jgi:hypothetical protein